MPLTRIKTKGLGTSVTFENITDTGTEGTKVATGTTAQRGSTTGQWRYNTTTNFFEGRNTSGTFSTLEPTPTITGVDDTEVDSAGGGDQTIVVSGTNFSSGGTITFVGNAGAVHIRTLAGFTGTWLGFKPSARQRRWLLQHSPGTRFIGL